MLELKEKICGKNLHGKMTPYPLKYIHLIL